MFDRKNLNLVGEWINIFGMMEEWKDGKMERWKDGKMERWNDGMME
jgi:hypothetical protein